MKRKLNHDDVPEAVGDDAGKEVTPAKPSFASFGLDSRLSQAVNREKFSTPTLVQTKAISLVLGGQDILGASCFHHTIERMNLQQHHSSRQNRLRQNARLPPPDPPLYPASQENHSLPFFSKAYCSTHSRPNKRTRKPSHLHHQNLHRFLRLRDPKREHHEERRPRRHTRSISSGAGCSGCNTQSCSTMDQ